MDSVRSGPYGQIFRPDNFVFGQVSTYGRGTIQVVAHRCMLACCLHIPLFALSAMGCRCHLWHRLASLRPH
jgi:hypothetical protein